MPAVGDAPGEAPPLPPPPPPPSLELSPSPPDTLSSEYAPSQAPPARPGSASTQDAMGRAARSVA